MLTDPIDNRPSERAVLKASPHWRDISLIELIAKSFGSSKSYRYRRDGIHLKTASPKGNRYAY